MFERFLVRRGSIGRMNTNNKQNHRIRAILCNVCQNNELLRTYARDKHPEDRHCFNTAVPQICLFESRLRSRRNKNDARANQCGWRKVGNCPTTHLCVNEPRQMTQIT
ncbi:hypothetical protein NPIL_469771 [Nephila pilipes]|uniref:Uncharacterized protein n=1 Tax=Nephila pilipes TaxID=299642 RepID=A0A8X6TFU9_NEPPI|nr:hypothetical protein NPIL_469771 [Nephila pilipes]